MPLVLDQGDTLKGKVSREASVEGGCKRGRAAAGCQATQLADPQAPRSRACLPNAPAAGRVVPQHPPGQPRAQPGVLQQGLFCPWVLQSRCQACRHVALTGG